MSNAGGHADASEASVRALDNTESPCRIVWSDAHAQHAALAISEGSTWVTRDSDLGKFEPHGLRWTHLVLE